MVWRPRRWEIRGDAQDSGTLEKGSELSARPDAICSMPGVQVHVAEAVGRWLSLRAWGNPRGRRLR
jgi:hypothetical protein